MEFISSEFRSCLLKKMFFKTFSKEVKNNEKTKDLISEKICAKLVGNNLCDKAETKKIVLLERNLTEKRKFKFFVGRKFLVGLLLLFLNFIFKTYSIERGNRVIWDEAHFGKFASRYLNREFYFDVHPPLGKMLTALSGYLFNQDRSFKFESGTVYPETMDYVGMRRFHAAMGSFIPVFAYGVFLNLGYSLEHSFFSSLLYVFENGMCSISRLILLDSSLMFFTASTAYFFTRFFKNVRRRRNSVLIEFIDLFFLGISLGCVMSVKWIGCLTTALVGIFIIYELWCFLMSRKKFTILLYKFGLRFICLIAVPMILYVLWFYFHFIICNTSTSDEAHMSSLFQAKLKNNSLNKSRKYVSFGSLVTIKSNKTAGGNLHSHIHNYPDSNYNQITTYFHKDENNQWAFQKVVENNEDADYLADGDEVVIFHAQTKSYLGADRREAYKSEGKRAIGVKKTITKNCVWKVEIIDDIFKKEERVKSVTTKFRLLNKESGRYLNWSGKTYPEWGFRQGEVTCVEGKEPGTIWNIEENLSLESDKKNMIEEYEEIKNFGKGFINHVLELNQSMYTTNKSLVQDDNLEPVRIVSRPYEWFILKRGLRMNGWDDDKPKFYMFGNPLIWYSSCICIILSPLILLVKTLYHLRNFNTILTPKEYFEVFLGFGGWAIHYLPFFIIGRVLYFHHYFPALFFGIMCINYVVKQFKIFKRKYSTKMDTNIKNEVFGEKKLMNSTKDESLIDESRIEKQKTNNKTDEKNNDNKVIFRRNLNDEKDEIKIIDKEKNEGDIMCKKNISNTKTNKKIKDIKNYRNEVMCEKNNTKTELKIIDKKNYAKEVICEEKLNNIKNDNKVTNEETNEEHVLHEKDIEDIKNENKIKTERNNEDGIIYEKNYKNKKTCFKTIDRKYNENKVIFEKNLSGKKTKRPIDSKNKEDSNIVEKQTRNTRTNLKIIDKNNIENDVKEQKIDKKGNKDNNVIDAESNDEKFIKKIFSSQDIRNKKKYNKKEKISSPIAFRIFIFLSFLTYVYFSPLTYGINGPATNIDSRKWIKSWDFSGK